ncbi:Fe-S cluster assembly protein NifU [Elusimicrobium minutum Pei191]|uniref:Nitrogen fixation protein NifU n=1 Tax=Elusimicrobium minutum (strain Pei191) TaxID=445932 RepID=B2KBH1_ELUMP|nr:Fe-S cluster assembly protein NifU [Elusimicrobium minutum]ACC97993.1 Fe-S cluster assembly protein NifU [Elusimicrobium minutum Pei191]
MWDYTDKVKEYFKNPKNVGEVENADGTGQVGSMVCGDALKLTLKIDKETEKITDAKFQTFGCASAIASSSILTEMVKGKTLEEASKITNVEIAEELGSLPEEKMHCSVMGMEALEAAIKSYRQGGNPVVFEEDAHNVVCKCFNVTEETIIKAVRNNNLHSVEDVTHFTKAGGACGKCKGDIQKIIDKVYSCEVSEPEEQQPVVFENMSIVAKVKAVEAVLEKDVRPKLNMDGGSVELVDIEGTNVKVKLLGACRGCMGAQGTIKMIIESALKDKISPNITVTGV